MGTLIMVGQLILSLSILIVLHEGGHFLPAKLFGARVEKFYLFFDPYFELFKFKKGETEYGIGWLPLGGYVKISGMIDESFDKEQMAQEPQPWEFRSKPAWQRLIIMLGGVTVNFILGLLIFVGMLFYWGEQYYPNENITHGIYTDSLGMELGLLDGDKILKYGEHEFDKFSPQTIKKDILINNTPTLTVDRNGTHKVLTVPENFSLVVGSRENRNMRLFGFRIPFIVDTVVVGKPADKAGLKSKDKIIAFNGNPTPYYHDFRRFVAKMEDEEREMKLTVLRNGTDTLLLNVTSDAKHLIGVGPVMPDHDIIEYSFAESIPAGINKGWNALMDQIKAFGQMFSGKLGVKDSVGSVFTISQAFGASWDWQNFWNLTAILSLILAFMNLLPIPALDGGHVMFLLYEVISGRKPNDKVVEYATLAGFILLVILMISVLGLDFWNAILRK